MPKYNWTRVQFPNGKYGYVKTDNNDKATEYKSDGTFKVYSQPNEKSHSFYTSFETRPRTIQRVPDDHEAHLAQQKQVDEKVRQTTPSTGQMFDIATVGGLNNLSPTQWMRRVYDTGQLIQGYMPLNEYMNKLYFGNNGIVSDEYARKHPYRAMATNLVGDIATFGTASTLRPVKVVSPQQTIQVKQFIHPAEVVRTGRQYVRPSVQKGMVSEPLMNSKSDLRAAITPEDLTNRKFFSVEEYGPEPIYTRETVPQKIKVKKGDITESHMNDGTPGSEVTDANKVANEWFNKADHGQSVSYETDHSLSTDSYPIALLKMNRWQQQGLGQFIQSESAPKWMRLNRLGNKSFKELQEAIARVNKLTGQNYKIEQRLSPIIGSNGQPTLHPITGQPLMAKGIYVQPIGFFKYKNGNKIRTKLIKH